MRTYDNIWQQACERIAWFYLITYGVGPAVVGYVIK